MALFGLFRRRPPIRDVTDLADFFDAQGAFISQKGIYEYSRARAGHYAKVLFSEPGFKEAVEKSRWQAYPIGLVMVAEAIEGVLRPHAEADRAAFTKALSAIVLSVFDRYPLPAPLSQAAWDAARLRLANRLDLIALHPPKRVMDIPDPLAQTYFDLMPIHEQLRGRDFMTVRNYLKVALCNIHEEFSKRADAAAIAAALCAHPG